MDGSSAYCHRMDSPMSSSSEPWRALEQLAARRQTASIYGRDWIAGPSAFARKCGRSLQTIVDIDSDFRLALV